MDLDILPYSDPETARQMAVRYLNEDGFYHCKQTERNGRYRVVSIDRLLSENHRWDCPIKTRLSADQFFLYQSRVLEFPEAADLCNRCRWVLTCLFDEPLNQGEKPLFWDPVQRRNLEHP